MLDFGNKKQWCEELFENYSEKYDKESFTQGTIGECDFMDYLPCLIPLRNFVLPPQKKEMLFIEKTGSI